MSMMMFSILLAALVSAEDAGLAVGNWLEDDAALGCSLGSSVESVRTETTTNGVNFHVVAVDGGGYVVTAGDTRLGPVLAFSEDDASSFIAGSPLYDLIAGNLAAAKTELAAFTTAAAESTRQEKKWARLLTPRSEFSTKEGKSTLSDIRVASFVKSRWNQTTAGGKNVYNYYTPNNYYCGCVATAGAQVLRYFEYPDSSTSIDQQTKTCTVDGTSTSLTTIGGVYNWSDMPYSPGYGITTAQQEAVGKLCYDFGVLMSMSYSSEGSGAYTYQVPNAFSVFGLSSKVLQVYSSTDTLGKTDIFRRAFISNCDARRAMVLGINKDGKSGHAIVGDGYGYSDGELYLHLNLGWGGSADAWYLEDSMETGYSYTANNIGTLVFNVTTNAVDGANTAICSGRILDAYDEVIANATVTAYNAQHAAVASATSDAKGIYALMLAPGSYTIEATAAGQTESIAVTIASCVKDYYGFVTSIGNLCEQNIVLGVEVDPVVVWQIFTGADATSGLTDATSGSTIKANGNTVARKTVTIAAAADGGILFDWPTGWTNVTAIFDCELPAAMSGDGNVASIRSTATNGVSDNKTGVYVQTANSTPRGIWLGDGWDPTDTSTLATAAVSLSACRLAFKYDGGIGTYLLQRVGSDWSTVYSCTGLKASGDRGATTGIAIGGQRGDATRQFAGLKLKRIAIFDRFLSDARIADYEFPVSPDARGVKLLVK